MRILSTVSRYQALILVSWNCFQYSAGSPVLLPAVHDLPHHVHVHLPLAEGSYADLVNICGVCQSPILFSIQLTFIYPLALTELPPSLPRIDASPPFGQKSRV